MNNHTPAQIGRRGFLRAGAGVAGLALLGTAGCSSKSGGSGNAAGNATLDYYYQPCMLGQNAYAMDLMQKTFDIKFSAVYALSMADYTTKFQANLAQGKIPDAMAINGPDMLQKFAQQGAFAEVSVDEIRQYMPKYAAGIDEHVPAAWATCLYDGKNYGFPGIGQPNSALSSFTEWRTDLLEKAGVSGVPDTLDEYESAFAALKKIGVYGMSTNGQSFASAFMTIFGAYGVLPMQWQLFDGKVANAAIRPETKQALELLASWYKKGYIDPECMGPDPSPKFVAGKVAMWDYGGPVDIDPTNQSGRLYAVRQTNPKGKIAFGLPPLGPGGRGSWTYGTAGWPVTFGPQAAKDKGKLREVLKIWDTIWSDNQLATKLAIGTEGTMYKLTDAAKGLAGGWQWIGKYVDPVARQADGFTGYGSPFIGASNWEIGSQLAVPRASDRVLVQTYGKYGHADVFQNPMTVPGSGEYTAALQSLKIKAFSQIITGASPLSAFDDFVSQWNAQGGSKLEKAANDLYEQTAGGKPQK
jgi:putative aldouronate transport system substrate-binding protein